MARPLRLEHAGALWHVTARGNERRAIVRNDEDRQAFVRLLGRTVAQARWRLHAWVLMTNHYHLLLETPEPTLSRGMRQLGGVYSQAFNRRHDRSGHLMQGRFKSILVERESHLLELARYVVLNPVRAGMVTTPAHYRWSSYRATAGLSSVPEWLEVGWTLAQFASRRGRACGEYRFFVSEGRGADYAPWDEVVGQVYLGREAFVSRMGKIVAGAPRSREHPSRQLLRDRPSLEAVTRAVVDELGESRTLLRTRWSRNPGRALIALLGRREAGATLAVIGDRLGLTPSGVKRLVDRTEEAVEENRALRKLLARVTRQLSNIQT